MRFIAEHPGRYYAGAIVLSLVLPVLHPGLSLVSIGILVAMIPIHLKARKQYPRVTISPRPARTQIQAPPATAPGQAPVQGTVTYQVVGTNHYHGLDDLDDGPVPAELRRERGNNFDSNAIAVWAGDPLSKAGYIPADVAARHAPRMDASSIRSIRVTAQMTADWRLMVDLPALPDDPSSPLDHLVVPPADLTWTSIDGWGPSSSIEHDIDEEYLHRAEIAQIFTSRGEDIPEYGNTLWGVEGLAVRKDDAVHILVDGLTVGRLAPADEATYGPVLRQLAARHEGLQVTCRIWATVDSTVRSRVIVWLPLPDQILPPASVPAAPHVVLPAGAKIQVTGEEDHLNELSALLDGKPEVLVAATLHEIVPTRANAKTYVEVRIHDEPVGRLTPTSSGHMLPIIQACAEERLLVVCRAVVKGNNIKADVILNVTKAGDLSHDWITQNVVAPDDYEPSAIPPAPAHKEDW